MKEQDAAVQDSTFTPWFQQWYECELQRDLVFQGMTWLQKLLYRCLCQRMFVCETQPYAPDDDNLLWVLAGAENKQMWLDNKDAILVKFERAEIEGKPLWKHKRVEKDWQDVQERREQIRKIRSEAGKRGNAKRWGDRKIANVSQTVANGRKNYASGSDSASDSGSGSKYPSISTSTYKSECLIDASLETQESKPKPEPTPKTSGETPEPPSLVSWYKLSEEEKAKLDKLCEESCGDVDHKPDCLWLAYHKRATSVRSVDTPLTPARPTVGDDDFDDDIQESETPTPKVRSWKSQLFDDGICYPKNWDLLSAAEKRTLISQHKVKH